MFFSREDDHDDDDDDRMLVVAVVASEVNQICFAFSVLCFLNSIQEK